MKKLLISFIICLFFNLGNAQYYSTGIGVRGGLFSGLTAKKFLDENIAVEGIFVSRWQGFQVTGLYQYNRVFRGDHLSYFYGAGGSIGFFEGEYVPWINTTAQHTVIGIDGIIGLEYCFESIPFSISIDYKPTVIIAGYGGALLDNGALTIRYIIL
jgi:hypothetical protein